MLICFDGVGDVLVVDFFVVQALGALLLEDSVAVDSHFRIAF